MKPKEEVNKVIRNKRYYCRKVPVMKQLKFLPLMGPLLEEDNDNFSDVDFEGLFCFLAKESKLRCENVQLGEQEIEAELAPYMDEHFESLDELMEVMAWCLEQTFAKENKK